MSAEAASPPAEQRVLAALYTATGCALMLLFVWQHLDPDGPTETFARQRERWSSWRARRRELRATLDQIHELPETGPERCEEL